MAKSLGIDTKYFGGVAFDSPLFRGWRVVRGSVKLKGSKVNVEHGVGSTIHKDLCFVKDNEKDKEAVAKIEADGGNVRSYVPLTERFLNPDTVKKLVDEGVLVPVVDNVPADFDDKGDLSKDWKGHVKRAEEELVKQA